VVGGVLGEADGLLEGQEGRGHEAEAVVQAGEVEEGPVEHGPVAALAAHGAAGDAEVEEAVEVLDGGVGIELLDGVDVAEVGRAGGVAHVLERALDARGHLQGGGFP
jgi:hypothetical protein